MRLKSLQIQNYRAIKSLNLVNLNDTVIIAGPNGCGKSCVFDAIRLLKSIYGGYQPNEYYNFFSEFQIRLGQRSEEILEIFQDKSKPLYITAEIVFASEEIDYLLCNGRKMLESQIWKELAPELAGWRSFDFQPMATQLRIHAPEVNRRVEEVWPELQLEIKKESHCAFLEIDPAGVSKTIPSRLLELVFSTYEPKHIGIIDFHGATRNYQREQVGGVNLNIEASDDQMRQHSLYNYQNKYANLKTQMASGYVRKLLAKEMGGNTAINDDLTETLKELFHTFFPGKVFLGPQPTSTGGITFPVRTIKGSIHDIDELSSGEKEVLYGYLRLRNSSPNNSIVLIDEPELHLNPLLIRGLAGFYHEHIGKALNNQLWLVSHSDTLIRDAVGRDGFSIFHMQSAEDTDEENQVSEVKVAQDIEKIVIDLVGDLAAYRPQAKIVIFEGGGDSAFDIKMVGDLFPEFISKVNPISGGNKRRVRDLYDLLEQTRIEAQVPARFFSITDLDDENLSEKNVTSNSYTWSSYHIENYLLVPKYILHVLNDLLGKSNTLNNEALVEVALLESAKKTISDIVIHQLRTHINQKLIGTINLGFDPKVSNISTALSSSIEHSQTRLLNLINNELNQAEITELEIRFREEAEKSLTNEEWKRKLRGRDILKRFVGKHGGGVAYEQIRNLVVARMRDDLYQPIEMKIVLDDILSK